MAAISGEKRRIRRHILNLDSPDQEVSARAEGYLIRFYGVRALDELLTACRHPNSVVRLRAAWALGCTQDPRAFKTILRLTEDPDERVRYDSTIALGLHDDPRAVRPLIDMWLKNEVTQPAGMAFSRMGAKSRARRRGGFPKG